MKIFNAILNCLSTGYMQILKNLQNLLAHWITAANFSPIKDCSGGNNSPSQHSLRRAVSFLAGCPERIA